MLSDAVVWCPAKSHYDHDNDRTYVFMKKISNTVLDLCSMLLGPLYA